MPRRKKMENISLEEQLVTVEQEIKNNRGRIKRTASESKGPQEENRR